MVSPHTARHTELIGDTGRGCVGGSLCCNTPPMSVRISYTLVCLVVTSLTGRYGIPSHCLSY